MRAIQLTMSAFGPYKDKQIIDFRQLAGDSLFLITGPTGAGKTTIFDAMCYALYGRASGTDRDQDSLRSHFASPDEQTEVMFRFQLQQKEFEVIRSPKQIKRKERGEGFTEQPPKAELYEYIHGDKRLLYSRVKDVNEAIEELLQLDYEQFRKMVMIPQGEFRRLISENSRERETILQKIFRTYVYKDITNRLVEKSKALEAEIMDIQKTEKVEIQQYEWGLEKGEDLPDSDQAIGLLSEYQEQEQKQLRTKKEKLDHTRKKLQEKQKDYYKAKEIHQLFEEYGQLSAKIKELEDQKEQISHKRERLKSAGRAELLSGYEKQLSQRKQELEQLVEKEKHKSSAVTELEQIFAEVAEAYENEKKAEPNREKQKELLKSLEEEYRLMDQYHQLQKNEQLYQQQYQKARKEYQDLNEQVKQKEIRLEQLEQENHSDDELVQAHYEMEASVKEWKQLIDRGQYVMKELQKLEKLRGDYKEIKSKYSNVRDEKEKIDARLSQLEEQLKQQQAAILAGSLQPDEPCPVCGSVHHPAKAKFSGVSVTDEEIEHIRKTLNRLEKQEEQWQREYLRIESLGQSQKQLIENMAEELNLTKDDLSLSAIQAITNDWNKTYQNKMNQLEQSKQQLEKRKQKIIEKKELSKKLADDRKRFEKKRNEVNDIKEKWIRLESQIENIKTQMTNPNLSGEELKKKLEQEKSSYKQMINQWETIQKQYEDTKEELQKARVELAAVQEQKGNEQDQFEEAEKQFYRQLIEKGFKNIEDYQHAKLKQLEQEKLEKEIKTYEEQWYATNERYQVLKEKLKDTEIPDLLSIEKQLDDLNELIDDLMKEIQQIDGKRKQYEKSIHRLKELKKKREKLERKYFDVGELARLARGDNDQRLSLERFVLSSFLDEILLQANIRLDRMTDHRFELIRSEEVAKRGAQSGLDLEVIDHYTGQKRSVRTLSGGEGFKAALSLALGMADVVQAHAGGVELDTMFIDEGFGTLDELSVEQALSCLHELQNGNRILGIISHVPKLKEEIQSKLHIQPSPAGSIVTIL